MSVACINAIGTAVPDNDIHAPFVSLARTFLSDERSRAVFDRMAERAAIEHRYSFMRAGRLDAGEIDVEGFYNRETSFPSTADRMARYQTHAHQLAQRAVDALQLEISADWRAKDITHLIVASCTGFTAPGLDLQLVESLQLRADVERTIIGFMGCSAAIPALRVAHHIVRSDPEAQVLVVNVELCTLHLHKTDDIEKVLSFLLFGDGASAALVTSRQQGLALDDFRAAVLPSSADLITWSIGNEGFQMHLSGRVPACIARALNAELALTDNGGILRGGRVEDVTHWAVHAGGRAVLDAVANGLALPEQALKTSRSVLSDFGNMSSATVMFVLQRILRGAQAPARGIGMAFGPGLVAETFRFRALGRAE